MNTLDDLINGLVKIRDEIGGDRLVFVDGWNDSGIVLVGGIKKISVRKTGDSYDLEVIRVWEECNDGEQAVFLARKD
jgi:hypothetical protein